MSRVTKATDAAQYANDARLAEHFCVHKATIWNWVRRNGFPKPVKLSAQISRWKWKDVKAWEKTRK